MADVIIVQVGTFADGTRTKCYQLYRKHKNKGAAVYAKLDDGFPNDPRDIETVKLRLKALKAGPESKEWADVMDAWDQYHGRDPGSWKKSAEKKEDPK